MNLVVSLLLDGIMGSVNQLLLRLLVLSFYINKIGLDVSNLIFIITNTAGFILKLVEVVLVYFTRRSWL